MTHPKRSRPRTVLLQLAQSGRDWVSLEALRLLQLNIPRDWPKNPRGVTATRLVVLRRIACDRRKSGRIRIMAVKELLFALDIATQLTMEAEMVRPRNRKRKTAKPTEAVSGAHQDGVLMQKSSVD